MQHGSRAARGAMIFGALGGVTAACGAGADATRTAHAPASDMPGNGIGLVSFDAGSDVQSTEVDAAAIRVKEMRGRLAPEEIQGVVRASFGTLRKCYEHGLRTSPNIIGRVTVKFVIDTEGRVATSADEKSDFPDAAVVKCVVDGFRVLRFPKPEGGMVTVVYPIVFDASE